MRNPTYRPGEPTWIDLGTPDLDASAAFYGGLFGWTVERGDPAFGGYSTFVLDGHPAAGVMPLMSPEQPVAWSTYVCTDDADAVAARVTDHGGSVLAPPMDVGALGRMAVLADPAGASFGVWQQGTHTGMEVVGEEGAYAWTELSTHDRAGALRFYPAVFGWVAGGGDDYTEFTLPGDGPPLAGCMDAPPTAPADRGSRWMPFFSAADPAAKAQQAAGLGATVLVPFMDLGDVAFSVVRDPQGADFGLLHLVLGGSPPA